MESWWEEDEDEEQFVGPPAWADSTQQSKTEPGDPIGIKTVQYILMSQTQMSLSHFHTAGMSALGIEICPSIADTMNNRYTKDNTSMKFELLDNTLNIRGKLVGVKFMDLVKNIGSNITGLPDKENIWYTVLNQTVEQQQMLRFYIDYNKLKYYNLTLQQVASVIFKNDCTWYVSPDFMGMIDICLPSSYLDAWLGRLEHIVCGTENISSVSYSADNKIVTTGSDICTVSKLDCVKKHTIFSNNINEVEKYFGIEAAMTVLETLLQSTIISNFMTRTGFVQPFVKSSSEICNKGLLFSMGFERPKDDIIRGLRKPAEYSGKSVYTDIMTGKDPKENFDVMSTSS